MDASLPIELFEPFEPFTAAMGSFMPLNRRNDNTIIDLIERMLDDHRKHVDATIDMLASKIEDTGKLTSVLSAQVTALSTQHEALRTDFINKWAELPKIYVPRAEHQAMGTEAKINELNRRLDEFKQEFYTAQQKTDGDVSKHRFEIDARTMSYLVLAINIIVSISMFLIGKFF